MDSDDEFGFSDHDLDDLPANTLQQLETTAIRATQHPNDHAAPGPDYDDGGDGNGNGDDGDEVINLDDAAAPTHVSQWGTAGAPQFTQAHQGHAYSQANSQLYNDAMEVEQPPRSQIDPNQLLLRIRKAEQDRARMKRELEAERSKAQIKSGEADTLRRRADTARRETEQKQEALRKEHNETVARLRAEVDKLRKEKVQAKTNSMFMEHDARDMAHRTRRAVSSKPRATTTAAPSPTGTPRRGQKTLPLRGDGFDDDDIAMASPTKKVSTPKQAGKRKRQAADQSPIPALQLSEPRERPKETEPIPTTESKIDTVLLDNLGRGDRRFTLLRRLLSQRSSNGTDRILEALSQYAFPSSPEKKLSSILYDSLSPSGISSDVHHLALRICHVFLDLWERCLGEKYYTPIYLIFDALNFVLACEPGKVAVEISSRIIPLIIASVDLVALPVGRAKKGNNRAIMDLYSPPQRKIASQIDVLDCLDLLYQIAASCFSSPSATAISHFWQAIPSDFVLLLLIKEQPLPHIKFMLRILSTSVLSTSLGPVVAVDSQQDQTKREDNLIHRLTNLFVETPETVPDPSEKSTASSPPCQSITEEQQVWDLRLLVLSVLTTFSIPSHGATRLALHKNCIGRLFKYLDHCITSLYTSPLSPSQALKIKSINATMKLIYHIASSNPSFDVKSKLVGILGGHHAYLVSLTRLAFSEGLVLEEGIEESVVDMAHEILDQGLSIEEGEGLMKVFSSATSV